MPNAHRAVVSMMKGVCVGGGGGWGGGQMVTLHFARKNMLNHVVTYSILR